MMLSIKQMKPTKRIKRFMPPAMMCSLALSGCALETMDPTGPTDPGDQSAAVDTAESRGAQQTTLGIDWHPIDHSAGGCSSAPR